MPARVLKIANISSHQKGDILLYQQFTPLMGAEKDMLIFRFGAQSIRNGDRFGTIKVNVDSILPSDQVFEKTLICEKM